MASVMAPTSFGDAFTQANQATELGNNDAVETKLSENQIASLFLTLAENASVFSQLQEMFFQSFAQQMMQAKRQEQLEASKPCPTISKELAAHRLRNEERSYYCPPTADSKFSAKIDCGGLGAQERTEDQWMINDYSDSGLFVKSVLDGHGGREVVNHAATAWHDFLNGYVQEHTGGDRSDTENMITILKDGTAAMRNEIAKAKYSDGAVGFTTITDRNTLDSSGYPTMYAVAAGDCNMQGFYVHPETGATTSKRYIKEHTGENWDVVADHVRQFGPHSITAPTTYDENNYLVPTTIARVNGHLAPFKAMFGDDYLNSRMDNTATAVKIPIVLEDGSVLRRSVMACDGYFDTQSESEIHQVMSSLNSTDHIGSQLALSAMGKTSDQQWETAMKAPGKKLARQHRDDLTVVHTEYDWDGTAATDAKYTVLPEEGANSVALHEAFPPDLPSLKADAGYVSGASESKGA